MNNLDQHRLELAAARDLEVACANLVRALAWSRTGAFDEKEAVSRAIRRHTDAHIEAEEDGAK